MKKIVINIATTYVFILVFIAFIPMKNLYFLAEQKLQNKNLFINQKSISSFLVNTSINDGQLYFEDIKALIFKQLSIKIWFLYNSVSMTNIKIDKALKDFLPLNIEYVSMRHTIFYPLKVFLSAKGDFGQASGDIDFYKMLLRVELKPSDIMKKSFSKLLNMMKTIKSKGQKTRYIYELHL